MLHKQYQRTLMALEDKLHSHLVNGDANLQTNPV